MGEPRPSDIAPPSPVFERRCFDFPSPEAVNVENSYYTSNCHRRNKSAVNYRKSTGNHEELIYCPLPISDDDETVVIDDNSSEDVFLSENSVVRYYNFAGTNQNSAAVITPRRHSVGGGSAYYNSASFRDRKGSIISNNAVWSVKEPVESRDEVDSKPNQVIIHATADGESVNPVLLPISVSDLSRASSVMSNSNGLVSNMVGSLKSKKKCAKCAVPKGKIFFRPLIVLTKPL